jgi:hypothetical protein
MGQGFAQQKSPMNQAAGGVANAWQQKPRQAFGQKPSPTAGQIPGAGGSNSMILAKQKAQQAASQGGGLGPSNPLQQLQQNLAKQKGLTAPYEAQQSALEQQIQASKPDAIMGASQAGPAVGAMGQTYGSPMQAAMEQMRGYDGPDLGSQDPRELARVAQMSGGGGGGQDMGQLYGQMPMNQVPELPVGNYGRPDVMDRGGIGPSAQLFGGQPMQGMQQMAPQVQMDENGMEPRRGAR